MKSIYVVLIILLGLFILGFSSNSSTVGRFQLSATIKTCWVLDTVTGELQLFKHNEKDGIIYQISKGDN